VRGAPARLGGRDDANLSDPYGGGETAVKGSKLLDRSALSENLSLRQKVSKPAVSGAGGVVAAHHRVAAEVGAEVLRRGGNAVDAAIATAFAVGVAEPWMSGIGGIGAMLIREARSGRVSVVDFGARAPARLDPAAYQIVPGADLDLFGWPRVVENRNLVGPYAVAVPAMVAGHAMAHELFGRMPWAELVAPAADLAEAGAQVDGQTSLWITSALGDLARDPGCRALFLRNGVPPVPPGATLGAPPRLKWPALAATLRIIADKGPRAFYEGPVARSIAAEVQAGGGFLSEEDLAGCRAVRREPAVLRYRGYEVHVAPELNGGPTMLEALEALAHAWSPGGPEPDGAAFAAFADALRPAWARRLEEMGDRAPHATSTTNLCVLDRDGNVVVVTQTLLSLFGARLLLPETGVLMNNGINWFDPRPGVPNAIGPGKRVLSNYTPTIAVGEGDVIGLGGAGGRKIMPAVFNLLSFMIDYGMSLEAAMHAPRIDVSGPGRVVADRNLPEEVLETLGARHPTLLADRAGYPYNFTIASAVRWRGESGEGSVEPWQPVAEAVAA
jgi:gamma-glutamyltranspeptidase/glutathione hydrolase